MKYYLFAVVLWVLLLSKISKEFDQNLLKNIEIEKADRKIETKNQYVNVVETLKVLNKGDENVNKFYITIPKELENNLILLIVKAGGFSSELKYSIIENLDMKSKYDIILYEVYLLNPIPSKEKMSITIEQVFYNRMIPFPKKITMAEDQLVILRDNALLYTPYNVASQQSSYTLKSTPLSFTENSFSNNNDNNIEYGEYTNKPPFSVESVKFHFENNVPFGVFKKVIQTIEVSHWGNIAVEGWYELANEGANLTGEYSRVDYHPQNPNVGKNALRNLKAELPYYAWGVFIEMK